ncbi:MAG: nucleotidyltransferase substrate binding protein [Pseudomonas sp.]|nr:nucleotidyltransferase substrate binding protein [Pseudomonas sp.]
MIYLNTEHLERCIRTLRSSLDLYVRAEPDSIEQEVFRNAIVKGYELVQETAFKLLRKALREFGHGARKLNDLPIKDVLRLAASHGLMSIEAVERWFAYRDNRNNTAHDYGEGFAKETLVLLPAFLDDVSELAGALASRLGKDSDHAQT